MARSYAIVENGKVVNIALSDTALADNWIASEVAQIGWDYSDGAFAPPPPPPEPPEPPEPTPEDILAAERAGMVVSRFQAKAALLQAGLLDPVEAALAGADPVARLAWAEAVEFRRLSPTIATLAASLGLSEAQLDDLFRAAGAIEA